MITAKHLMNQKEASRHLEIFNELGFNKATAINMFLRTAIGERGIPFDLKLDVPNDVTASAIEEGRKLLTYPASPKDSNMDDLKSALNR